MGRSARRKRSVSKQSEAGIARVLIVALWLRNRRHSPVRTRIIAPVQRLPFGSAQPSHGCVRDTDQLVEFPHIDMTDAGAQKNPVLSSWVAL